MGLTKRTYIDQETVITADNMNDIQDSIIALEDGSFSCTATGESIAVTDSSSNKLLGLNLYGKSTQDGTPTPEAPVDIVSVGDGGSIEGRIYGKSIVGCYNKQTITTYGITFTINGDGSVTANGTATGDANLSVAEYNNWYLPKGKYKFSTGIKSNALVLIVGLKDSENVPYVYGQNEIEFVCKNSGTQNGHCVIQIQSGRTVSNLTFYPMIRVVSASSSFEKAKTPQPISISTPNGLGAIPVVDQTITTYTDVSSQMWCADEIDLARGVRVQRVSENAALTFGSSGTANGNVYVYSAYLYGTENVMNTRVISTHFKWVESGALAYMSSGTMFIRNTDSSPVVYCASTISTVEGFNAWVRENNVRFLSILATPIETPLTDEEIAAYKALHTNKPNTTVLNDSGAYMSMKYIADPKSYIDNKVSGILTATVE